MISASLIEDRVEVLSLFPILVQQFMHLHRSELANRTLPLKYVYTAASSLSLDLARAWFELTTVPLIQGYGMSEAINFTCSQDPYQDFSKTRFWTSERKRPSIGAPVRGNEVFILDPTGRQCDEGEVGELVVRGWNVMRGYEGDHSGTSQDYFHTGDIGYFENDPDTEKQFFFIQGRSKDVIKRSGETISLREVDEAIHNILLGSGYTGISVGFPNKHVGEEIGVVLRPAGELQVEPLGTLRLRLKNVPPLLRPRVGLLTHEELTTPSGKPQRWKFLQHFEKFEESLFAATLHLEEDFLR